MRCGEYMSHVEITAMKGITHIKGRPYIMYTGYMTPNQLIQFSNVPSFSKSDTHVAIANGLRVAPISNWQRPVKVERLKKLAEKIDAAHPNNDSRDSLMANPVLIGRSDQLNGSSVDIQIHQKTINVHGNNIPIPELYEIRLVANNANKPLWILDGQHRIHGLGNSPFVMDDNGNPIPNGTIVANEVIPVVFIIDASYQPKFLAKIFTEVTTEAKTMDKLHGDWMQFAFDLGDYTNNTEANLGLHAAIELSSMQTVDNLANPFFDRVKFNPHNEVTNPTPPFKSLTSLSFRKLLESSFYDDYTGPGKNWPEPQELATCFVRFYRAAVECDGQSHADSRLFSSTKGLEKLTNQFFTQFLNFIATPTGRVLIVGNTKDDWVEFLQNPNRLFHSSDWSLPNVSPGSIEKNTSRKASADAAVLTFKNLFFHPTEFGGIDPALWMQGPGEIGIESNVQAPQFNGNSCWQQKKLASGGSATLNLRQKGHKMIRFTKLQNSQATITRVERWDPVTNQYAVQSNPRTAITLTPGQNKTDKIKVTAICYSEDSKTETEYTVLS